MKLIKKICNIEAVFLITVWSVMGAIFISNFASVIDKITLIFLSIIWFGSLSYLIIWGTSE